MDKVTNDYRLITLAALIKECSQGDLHKADEYSGLYYTKDQAFNIIFIIQ